MMVFSSAFVLEVVARGGWGFLALFSLALFFGLVESCLTTTGDVGAEVTVKM